MAAPGVTDKPRVVVVGAGPAGVRTAQALVEAGLRPVVIDEAIAAGGQIYRRQPSHFRRSYETLYGADAPKARALHQAFEQIRDRIDYRPQTLVWNLYEGVAHTVRDGQAQALPFDAIVLATGATDRLMPVKGWTLPGCYSLGGAQIALKAQGCSIGRRVVFMGSGPLLYLVAAQYLKAGVEVAAVLDTAPFSAQVKAVSRLMARPGLLARGLSFRARLTAAGVPVHNGVTPLAVEGEGEVRGVRFRVGGGPERTIDADAVATGFHLRSETQLADLARCDFVFDGKVGQWRPQIDQDGRTSVPGVYTAGDGARVLGADAAETSGRLAAFAVLTDLTYPVSTNEMAALRARMIAMERFRDGLSAAFPWPANVARTLDDDVVVCRCELITAGDIRAVARDKDAPEMNRAKALSRVGMGRCQGRFCAHAAAEILAAARQEPLAAVGRLRGQAPVKPLSVATVRGAP